MAELPLIGDRDEMAQMAHFDRGSWAGPAAGGPSGREAINASRSSRYPVVGSGAGGAPPHQPRLPYSPSPPASWS